MFTILAADGTGLADQMGTAFATVQSDIMSVVWIALPIALGLVGTFLAIRLGLKFFKQVSGKS